MIRPWSSLTRIPSGASSTITQANASARRSVVAEVLAARSADDPQARGLQTCRLLPAVLEKGGRGGHEFWTGDEAEVGRELLEPDISYIPGQAKGSSALGTATDPEECRIQSGCDAAAVRSPRIRERLRRARQSRRRLKDDRSPEVSLAVYFSEATEHHHDGVTMQEVVSMLYRSGAKRRQFANEPLASQRL